MERAAEGRNTTDCRGRRAEAPDGSILYRSLRFVLGPPIRRLWLHRVEGLHHVPAEGGVILASNHESYLDFLVVPVSGCRLPRYLVGEVFFENPLLAKTFGALGFVPVDRRHRGNTAAVKRILALLREGAAVGIFPEGTRSPDGRLQKGTEGAAYFAHLTGAPVVPVGVTGTHEGWAKARRFPRPHPCTVRFGEPLTFSRRAYEADRGVLRHSTAVIMRRIAALTGEEYPW